MANLRIINQQAILRLAILRVPKQMMTKQIMKMMTMMLAMMLMLMMLMIIGSRKGGRGSRHALHFTLVRRSGDCKQSGSPTWFTQLGKHLYIKDTALHPNQRFQLSDLCQISLKVAVCGSNTNEMKFSKFEVFLGPFWTLIMKFID